jgi:hypothetical protein
VEAVGDIEQAEEAVETVLLLALQPRLLEVLEVKAVQLTIPLLQQLAAEGRLALAIPAAVQAVIQPHIL